MNSDAFFNAGLAFCVFYTLLHSSRGLLNLLADYRRRLREAQDDQHPWVAFLQARAHAIDWLYSGEGDERCKCNDAEIARIINITELQVKLIRTKERTS